MLWLALVPFVTLAFAWASLNPDPGNAARYFVFYFVWDLRQSSQLGVKAGVAVGFPAASVDLPNLFGEGGVLGSPLRWRPLAQA